MGANTLVLGSEGVLCLVAQSEEDKYTFGGRVIGIIQLCSYRSGYVLFVSVEM